MIKRDTLSIVMDIVDEQVFVYHVNSFLSFFLFLRHFSRLENFKNFNQLFQKFVKFQR